MSNADDTFLSRWSRRKSAARGGHDVPVGDAADVPRAASDDGTPEAKATVDGGPASRPLTEEDFADVDFSALDYTSDYKRFMVDGVPESVRQQALQKLWHSDTMFTQVDPFQDYAGDYTDAAVVPIGGLKTAYKIGRGFLSEEEAAEWDKLGKTPEQQLAIAESIVVTVVAERPDTAEVAAFFAASEAYMGDLYPAESNHFVGVEALLQPNVLFLVARRRGVAVGCGALVRSQGDTAEIKRMWVDADARRERIGVRLLEALLDAARGDGVSIVRLETGNAQPEALGLYRRFGFVERAAFGSYAPDPLSVFMELQLAAPDI
ncbi:MAG: GNAT family N-acetyltransferase [Hyphomicrobiaceae bacterium]|nr:GNAT family N-acetyltransferase [Hyphomicrobiaceae bacterium]